MSAYAESEELFKRAQAVIPGGVHSPVRAFGSVGGKPIFFRSASGAEIESVEGHRYIDFCQSFGPNILGHRDPDVQSAVAVMLDQAWTLGTCEPYSLELAEWICSRLPFVERARFVCSGTEAVMSALRLARGATGRRKVLKFSGCYNGHADALLVEAGSGLAGASASSSAGVPDELVSHTLVGRLDDIEGLERIIAEHGSDLAAVIIEPLPANFGLLPQRQEFLEAVAGSARDCGALVIFDEVISGFRMATGGMAEDLVTYGKVMGGGFPVGCYAGRADLMDHIAPAGDVYQAGTLSANPIGMVAGLTSLQKCESQRVIPVINGRAEQMQRSLQEYVQAEDLPLQVVQQGSILWLHWRTATAIRDPQAIPAEQRQWFGHFFHACLERGIYIPSSPFEVLFVSFAHTDEIMEQAIPQLQAALGESMRRMEAART